MKRTLKLLVLFMALNIGAIGQTTELGVTINPGISKMAYEGIEEYEHKWAFSGNAGVFIRKQIGKHSFVGAELLYLLMETRRNYYAGTSTASRPRIVDELGHYSYAALPIFFGLKYGKMSFRLGAQFMYLSKASKAVRDTKTDSAGVSFSEKRTIEIGKMPKFDFGPKAGLDWQLNKNLSLSLQYYLGLKSMADRYAAGTIQHRQATLGLLYSLHL